MQNDHLHVKPFQFEGIPKLKSRDLKIEEKLLSYLPFQLGDKPLKSAIEDFLHKQFRENCVISFQEIVECDVNSMMTNSTEQDLWVQLSALPSQQKAFALFDYPFVFNLIHRLLGAKTDPLLELRKLTALEEGVLEFLVLKVLSLIFEASNQQAMQFRLDQIIQGMKSQASTNKNQPVAKVLLKIQLGAAVSYLQLFLPHPLVESSFNAAEYSEDWLLQWNKMCLQKLGHIDYIKTQLTAEIGSVTLTIAEKNQLEKGDVILFDQTYCHFSDSHLSGNVVVKVEENAQQGFLAQVVSADSPVLVKIIDYYGGNHG